MTPVLRPAAPADIPALQAIEAQSPGASHWSPADYLSLPCTVAEYDGAVAAYLLARQVADDEWELLNVAVHPDFRRRGIAETLLAAAVSAHPGSWFLEVRPSNVPARNLYKKLGFRELSLRPGYYLDPPEGAIVMVWRS